MQNNPSSLDETYHSNQSVAAAELTNVSVECSDNMPFECNEPPEAQEMAQPPEGLVIEEVPENSESVNTEEHSVQASKASNPIEFNLSQSIRDDNRLHQFTDRLNTYSCWPSQIPQHREDMALAGFYYTGRGGRVRCAFCDLELAGWTKDVEPFSRHKQLNPRCSFMEEIRYRARMPTSHMNMTSLIDEKVVKEVLEWGFQWIDVERAVAKLLSCRCTDDITASEILKYLFQNETENEIQHVPNMGPCMVCRCEDPNILFLPCRHICCCQSCGEKCYLCSFCCCRIKGKKKIYIS